MTAISTKYSMHINFIVEFVIIASNLVILLYTAFLDILNRSFGVINTRKYANLDDHFSQYTKFENCSNSFDE